VTRVVLRTRRYRCTDCARTFVAGHTLFRERLAERVADAAADTEVARDEYATRYRQVARALTECTDPLEVRDVDRRPRRLSLDDYHRRGGMSWPSSAPTLIAAA
jgi:transposase